MIAYRGDLRYDVPGEAGRVGSAVASFHAAAAGEVPALGPAAEVEESIDFGG